MADQTTPSPRMAATTRCTSLLASTRKTVYLLDLWRGQTSSGVRQRPHPRNAPTILNAGLNFIIHWRGDRDNLEDQVIKALASPITNGQPDEKAIIGFTPLRNCRPNT